MRTKLVRVGLGIVLLMGLFFSARQVWDAKRAEQDSREAAQIAGLPGSVSASVRLVSMESDVQERTDTVKEGSIETLDEGVKGAAETLPKEAAALAGIDLRGLQEVNQDVLGWIAIPGTKLSYPIVQGEDNDEYLYRNWKKENNKSGSIFLESTNRPDFSDFHTIIYGHRMRDNSMFGILKYYQKRDFLEGHPDIYLVSQDAVFRYRIFAAYETGVKSMVYRLDLEEKGLEEEFIEFCRESSVVDARVIPEPEPQVLTLSTCTGRGHSTRWVVQGYLTQTYSVHRYPEEEP